MFDIIGISPVLCGSLLAGCIMYTVKNARLRDSQGKFLGLMIVILAIGVLIIFSGYRGLLSNPFGYSHGGTIESNYVKVTPSAINKGNVAVVPGVGLRMNDQLLRPEEKPEFIYGIMFDAGSTGSRIHVFKLKQSAPDQPFVFVDELFEKVQPGLSSYADHPKEAAASLKGMMDNAKKYIPEKQWTSTPIALKATAGLRKLKQEEADNILNEVKQLFIDYPFRQEDDSVVIMEGTDEGVFSWFTVNFYSGVLGDSEKMQGVMDLGGGSTQITFIPREKDTIDTADVSYLHDKNILGKNFQLYTHSYLDLGLMAGRLQILGGKVGSDVEEGAPLPVLTSPCLPDNYNGKIEFGQDEYTLKSSLPVTSRLEDCYNAAKTVVNKYHIHTSNEIQHKPFCTISYYYDRAVDSGLIAEEKGGQLKVSDFYASASKACSSSSADNPYLCLDLCYISALLQEGFKLASDNLLDVHKKINDHEISWALGAMFDFFNSHRYHR